MHLIFLVHGLFGNPGHMVSMSNSLMETLKDDEVVVCCAKSMSAVGTFNGVIHNAHLLETELLSELRRTGATKLSIVGYSMGGLCGRYLIGLLEERGIFQKVEPMVFATFATPHLGTTFPVNSVFGKLFNAIGSRVTGVSGHDLFNTNELLTDLADPKLKYFRGLQQFKYLFAFANTIRDRTVPFWTAYITAVDPFRYRPYVDLKRHETNWRFVDLLSSRWRTKPTKRPPRTWKQWLYLVLINALIPVLLTILLTMMSGLTIYTKIRNFLAPPNDKRTHTEAEPLTNKGSRRGSSMSDELMSGLGEAVDEALELTSRQSSVESSQKSIALAESRSQNSSGVSARLWISSPGYEGLIESCPNTLDLSPQIKTNIENLNKLPWRKYAVRIPSFNTHGIIVDRNNRGSEGKNVLDVFAQAFAKLMNE